MGTPVVFGRLPGVCALFALTLMCCHDSPEQVIARQPIEWIGGETALPLGVGRSFVVDLTYDRAVAASPRTIELRKASLELAVVHQGAAEAGPDFARFNELARRACQEEAAGRIPPLALATTERAAMLDVHELLCMGHLFLTMAESPMLTVLEVKDTSSLPLNDSGTIGSGTRVEVRYVADDGDVLRQGHLPAFVVRPQGASGAATLALLGSTYARAALLLASRLVRTCSSANYLCNLNFPVPVADDLAALGVADDVTEPLGLLLAKQVVESWHVAQAAVETTRRLILAASRGRLASDDLDPATERILRWRGLNDSRLEVANLIVGVAPRMFEPDGRLDLPAFDGQGVFLPLGPVNPQQGFPVMDSPRLTEADRRAEEILRGARVDPRSADLLELTFDALREDEGDSFVFQGSAVEYFQLHGITGATLRRAGRRLVAESAVFGHPIVTEKGVNGDVPPRTPPRVVGTMPSFLGPNPAFLYALTAGSVRIDSFNVRLNADFSEGADEQHYSSFPTEEYAIRSVPGALDFAAANLTRLLKELDYWGISEEHQNDIKQVALSLISEARNEVPLRVDLELSGPMVAEVPFVDLIDLHLYGSQKKLGVTPQETYELWWGEEGLECALAGAVSQVLCDEGNYRVDVVFTAPEGGGASGRELHYHAQSTAPPPPPVMTRELEGTEVFLPAGRLYLTRTTSNGRIALAGFDIGPAELLPGFPTWKRRTQYAVGPNILADIRDIVTPRADEPWEPAMTCAGLPHNVRLPLEDELTEAVTGADEIESSFSHYLALARTAAQEADDLAETLIRDGLEIDHLAESAREELEEICGAMVNVPSFTNAGSGAQCSTEEEEEAGAAEDQEEDPCPENEFCFLGRCTSGEQDDILPSDDDNEEQLRKCVGADQDDKVVVTLGSKPTCVFHKPGLPPCSCAEGDLPEGVSCPTCPAEETGNSFPGGSCCPKGEDGEIPVSCPISADSPFASLAEIPGYEVRRAEPLFVVDDELYGSAGGDPPDCLALARLRHRYGVRTSSTPRMRIDGEGGGDSTRSITNQEWLNLEYFASLAAGLKVNLQPAWHTSVGRGQRAWFGTGDIIAGANEGFPCQPLSDEIAAELGCNDLSAGPLGRSLLCGFEGCNTSCGTRFVNDQEVSPLCWADISCFIVNSNLDGSGDCTGRETIYHRLWRARREILRLGGYDLMCKPWHLGGGYGGLFVNMDFDNQMTGKVWTAQNSVSIPSQNPRFAGRDALVEYQLSAGTLDGISVDWEGEAVGLFKEWQNQLLVELWTAEAINGWSGYSFAPNDCAVVESGARAVCYHDYAGSEVSTEADNDDPNHSPQVGALGKCPYGILQNVSERLSYEGNAPAWFPDPWSSDTVLGRIRDAYRGEYHDDDVAFMDALELACLASQEEGGACTEVPEELPTVVSPADFPMLERMIRCAAENMEKAAGSLVLVDVPRMVVQDLQKGAISPTYPAVRGTIGQDVAELRGSLELVSASVAEIGSALRGFSNALRTARSQFTIEELQQKIAGQETFSTVSKGIAACVAASSPSTSVSVGSGGVSASTSFNVGAALATCHDSNTQEAIAQMIESLRIESSNENQAIVMNGVALAYSQSLDLMANATHNLSEAYANVNRVLAKIDADRRNAQRQLSRVMFLGNDSVGREFAVNRVMRARMNTTLQRYKDARENAIRLAWLARRAVEQRLGFDLSELTTNMSLVRAPATWVDQVCDLSGHNYDGTAATANADYDGLYDRIRTGQMENYASIYVGDYVRMLENVVESYRLDYPFQDGRDVAVLSLKNDFMKVYEPCEVPGHNLLFWSSDLRPGVDSLGWTAECSESGRCPAVLLSASSPFGGGTGSVTSLESTALGSVPGYRMTLGCLPENQEERGYCQPGDANGAGLAQTVSEAEPGLYVVSWYEKAIGTEPQLRAVVTGEDGVELALPENLPEADGFLSFAGGWGRTSAVFVNYRWQDLTVQFEFVEQPTLQEPEPTVLWAAPQFEFAGSMVDTAEQVPPRPFFPTDADLSSEVLRCEDVDGSSFRSQGNWVYGCEYYCADSTGETCGQRPLERSLRRCYYETEFTIALPQIERGDLVPSGSIALGNFNYRIDSLALNLVGTNLRNCDGSGQPSTCDSSGFLPYSLRHGPPFRIRNYWGKVYASPLYIGNIEHAKALAAERFLTNPIGSSDQAALADYTREEFRGRPLEGTYRLRIYDVEGLDWSKLEDVQIALRYRYWTHFGN
jgi:hypothetical protein